MDEERQFSWNAEDYAANSGTQQTWARELIFKLNLRADESVLDIGCGDGKITAEISERVCNGSVVGIDSSREMIELARRSFNREKYANLVFQVADAQLLPFEEEFDVVFSNATLHWIKEHRPVISGIQKSLKPDGRILLQMGGRGNAKFILAAMDDIMSEEQWKPYFSDFTFSYGFYGPEEYTQWVNAAGLEPIRIELIPKVMSYDSREGLAGWVRTTWLPYLEQVPLEKREEFIEALIARYLEKHPLDEQGRIHVSMVRLEVEAVKKPQIGIRSP